MAITFEDLKNLSERDKQNLSSLLLLKPEDELDNEQSATFGGILKQFALGAVNSALLDFPKFVVDRDARGVFRRSESKGERIARGTGTALGFILGAPAKVLAKGGQIAAKLAGKKLTGTALKVAKGAGAFGGLEAVTAPSEGETVFDKGISIPIAAGIGGAFGVAEAFIGNALKPHMKKLKDSMVNRSGRQYEDALSAIVGESVRAVRKVDRNFMRALDSKRFEGANKVINNVYAGTKRQIARTRLQIANSRAMRKKPEFRELLLKGDVAKTAEASLKNILGPGRNIAKEAIAVSTDAVKKISHKMTNNRVVSSGRARLLKSKGASAKIAREADAIRSEYEILGGRGLDKAQLATAHLSKAEKANVVDMLDGFSSVASTPQVAAVYKELKSTIYDDIAKRFTQAGGKVINQKRGILSELKPRATFFPHMVPPVDTPKKVVDGFIKEAVLKKRVASFEEGQAIWNSFVEASSDRGKKGMQAFSKYLIRTGQARNEADAAVKINGFLKKTQSPRFGNLERAREVNFPIYDNDLDRVTARYIMGAEQRIAEIKHFGQSNEKLAQLVAKAKEEGQDAMFVDEIMNRFTGATEQRTVLGGLLTPKQSSTIRSVQVVTKLGTAAIPNATQSINTSMVAGVQRTSKELARFLSSSKNRQQMAQEAVRGGIAMETSINEFLKGLGLDGSFKIGGVRISATGFLKKTGFTWLEKMNRVVGYHSGKSFGIDMGKKLVENPKNRAARVTLKRMGISTKKVLEKGGLDADDMVKAGRYVSDKTQFRAGPLDLPLWMSSPEGKLLAQFKSFGFNQAKFIKDALKEEVLRGNYRPLATALIAMPILGEGVRNIRGLISGQERDKQGMDRLLDNISAVGAAGLLNDLWASAKFNNIEGAILGPTGSDVAKALEGTQRAIEGRPKSLQRFALRNIPVVGPRLQNTFVPSNRLKRLREKRKREREKLRGK